MIPNLLNRSPLFTVVSLSALFLSSCAQVDIHNKVLVSVRDQKMMIVKEGVPVKSYSVSTSKFGLGDRPGSKYTPLGTMRIARKIGDGAPSGAVFKSRRRTGEVLRPNSPGRDPIVSRIIWLKGMEYKNRNAYRRYIYIHGTPEEWSIGRPASYGCIRMRSRDIIDLYRRVGVGAEVKVIRGSLFRTPVAPPQGEYARQETDRVRQDRKQLRAGPSI
ncbi:MAG: L,D-transpeptidase [Roseibacillus sp.]|nr:L,D-transpeptidase [Roseibacillus sp.]